MSCLCQDRFKQTTADTVEEKPRLLGKKQAPVRQNVDALFLRWRETIEKAISDKFDAGGSPDGITVYLFL